MTLKKAKTIILNVLKKQCTIPTMPKKTEDFVKYADNPEIMKMVRKNFADSLKCYRKFQRQLTVMANDMVKEAALGPMAM